MLCGLAIALRLAHVEHYREKKEKKVKWGIAGPSTIVLRTYLDTASEGVNAAYHTARIHLTDDAGIRGLGSGICIHTIYE
jgi:hypothetical protein